MGFNSAFKGLKLLKKRGNGRLNNLNYSVRNVLIRRKLSVFLLLMQNIRTVSFFVAYRVERSNLR
jgi:hypothetical protein